MEEGWKLAVENTSIACFSWQIFNYYDQPHSCSYQEQSAQVHELCGDHFDADDSPSWFADLHLLGFPSSAFIRAILASSGSALVTRETSSCLGCQGRKSCSLLELYSKVAEGDRTSKKVAGLVHIRSSQSLRSSHGCCAG